MGLGVDVRIDPERHARPCAFSPRHFIDGLKFRGRFHVEQQDIGVEGIGYFLATFSDAGKHDLAGGDSGLQRAKQFASRHDVGPAALRRHEPENGQVRIGLHGKRDEMGNRSEGLVEGLEVPGQRRVTVEVRGCALFLGQAFERNVFTEERIIVIVKIMHLAAALQTIRGRTALTLPRPNERRLSIYDSAASHRGSPC